MVCEVKSSFNETKSLYELVASVSDKLGNKVHNGRRISNLYDADILQSK